MWTNQADERRPLVSPAQLDVAAVAAELGLDLAREEMRSVQAGVDRNLALLGEFLADHAPSDPPSGSVRDGRRTRLLPAADDDPLNAWLSRCSISGSGTGLLSGSTVSFKDTIAVAGVPLTCGVEEMDDYVAEFDATVVRRALEEGATVVGKNTVLGGFGEVDAGHRPQNPHSPDHLTGGSSAGSAVAVVSGDVDVSFGGDQGGSIRIPAAWCGAVGMKPTFGLVSSFGVVSGADQSFDHVGPIARTVQDAAAALQAVAGYDPLDPRQGRDVPTNIDVLTQLGDGISGLRIGLLDEGFVGVDEGVAYWVRTAAAVLGRAGAEVCKASVPQHLQVLAPCLALDAESARFMREAGPLGVASRTWYPPSLVEALNRAWADHVAEAQKYSVLMGEATRRAYRGRAYAVAQNARPAFVAAYDRAFEDFDLLLMPTTLFTAPLSAGPVRTFLDFPTVAHTLGLTNTLPFNYTGHPALAIPCGTSDGLPVSFQLVGRMFDDGLLLRAGYAFQESVDFDAITAVASPDAG
ncbi:amidase family protein [Kribbella sp.]|uniref:amidase family protein n=1 Tax=Kribbella sp. TaxID=1871183 RepID=UPI002D55156D|nr:amidase family protein [Kribbella sp.]HZX08258.1 amidase family protein [Kribbella sp.]